MASCPPVWKGFFRRDLTPPWWYRLQAVDHFHLPGFRRHPKNDFRRYPTSVPLPIVLCCLLEYSLQQMALKKIWVNIWRVKMMTSTPSSVSRLRTRSTTSRHRCSLRQVSLTWHAQRISPPQLARWLHVYGLATIFAPLELQRSRSAIRQRRLGLGEWLLCK